MNRPLKQKDLMCIGSSIERHAVLGMIEWLKQEIELNWEAKITINETISDVIISKKPLFKLIDEAVKDIQTGGKQ